jgi:serine/threonine protein kinase
VNPEHAARFKREARAIAALNHPHICTLHDVGADYLVMDLVEGSALRGPMPVQEAVRFAVEIADALATAHARGIIHRELKPGNIMLTKSGVKLLDVGLAKVERAAAGDETATQTQVGTVMVAAAYMSPERAAGKPVDA